MKIGKEESEQEHRMETHLGSQEDLVKFRKKTLPELTTKIEKLFSEYQGGGVTIVMNNHDKDGDCVGLTSLTVGVDEPKNMLRLAKALRQSAEMLERQASEEPTHEIGKLIDALLEKRK